jgi:hypothetical protein
MDYCTTSVQVGRRSTAPPPPDLPHTWEVSPFKNKGGKGEGGARGRSLAADSHADSACDVCICMRTVIILRRSGRVDLPGPDWVRLSEKGPDSREERAERREVGSLGEQRRVSMALGLGIVLNFFPENSRHIPFPNRCRDACGPAYVINHEK